jgi:hypothetical protein
MMVGAIQGVSKVQCSACAGTGTADGVDVTVEFATEGYPRSGYNFCSLHFYSLDMNIHARLSLEDTQKLRDRLEVMLQKFWSESDGENPHRRRLSEQEGAL